MGFNYGQFRNRGESLKTLPGVVLQKIGETSIAYSKYDFQETAELVNRKLDEVQARYNLRFNFPPSK